MKQELILSERCESRQFESNDPKLVSDAVKFNVASLCPKCSGGITCGTMVQVFHPCAHLNAKEIVRALADKTGLAQPGQTGQGE
jgi:hypothetical protein